MRAVLARERTRRWRGRRHINEGAEVTKMINMMINETWEGIAKKTPKGVA